MKGYHYGAIYAMFCTEAIHIVSPQELKIVEASHIITFHYPIGSMYGICTYIWLIFMVNVAKYTIHGYCGYSISYTICSPQSVLLALLVPKFVVEFWHVLLSLIQTYIYIYVSERYSRIA